MKRQTSTVQVPVDRHSIFDAAFRREVTMLSVMVYLTINYFSNWQSGRSHAISYTELANYLGVKRSRVVQAVKILVEKGYLEKRVRNAIEDNAFFDQNTPNTYRVIHHVCDPKETPTDPDGYPKKCAMPRGEGSAFEKMFRGEISWRACLYWCVSKVVSDWGSGKVEMTIKETRKWLKFGQQSICNIRKELLEAGLLEQLSKKFRTFVAQLLPAPYEKRRKRRWENRKGMRRDAEFSYSYNERWRVSHTTGQIQTKETVEGVERWRHANEHELESVNKHIHKDFMMIVELVLSPKYQRYVQANGLPT